MPINKKQLFITLKLFCVLLGVTLYAQTEINKPITLKFIREIKLDKSITEVSFGTCAKEEK